MAEQKIDDTKIAAARRGARPFAGPTGAATSPRPFSRPAAPAARPANGPFAPPSARRPALGAIAPPLRPAETLVAVEAASAAEQPAVAHPVIVASTATSGEAHAEGITSALEAAIVEVAPSRRPVTSEMVALDAFDAFEAAWNGVDATDSRPLTDSQPLETLTPSAIDDASLGDGGGEGDYVWTHDMAVPDAPALAEHMPDVQNRDGDGGWPTAEIGMPVWLADDSHSASNVAAALDADVDWSDAPGIPSADDVIASSAPTILSLGDATETTAETPQPRVTPSAVSEPVTNGEPAPMTPFTTAVVETESWPDPLLAEYAPYVSVSRETPAYLAVMPPTPTLPAPGGRIDIVRADAETETTAGSDLSLLPYEPVAELSMASELLQVAQPPAVQRAEPVAELDRRVAAGMRISATLDRLAERVRGGEIDVSSVAPDATDAAVLASVLAALLGGSSSR
jgi:hypothetical protein